MSGIGGWIGEMPDGQMMASTLLQHLRHRGTHHQISQRWTDAALIYNYLQLNVYHKNAPKIHFPAKDIWAVVDGEIYNRQALQQQLAARGHQPSCDSELIACLYAEYGEDCLSWLRGMFAIAIVDRPLRRLILARDSFGLKPLFYAPMVKTLAFASEVPPLRALPDVDTTPDAQAIADLVAMFFIPAPMTFYKGIRTLQPGEMLIAQYDGEGVHYQTRFYHRWTIAPDNSHTLESAVERTHELMQTALRTQTTDDVPYGAYLSGGIDSSLISATAQGVTDSQLHTFNVRFAEAEADETRWAQLVANAIHSQHHVMDMSGVSSTWADVAGLLQHIGQPVTDIVVFANHALVREVRQHVPVVFSGNGAEMAFGYGASFQNLWPVRWIQMLPVAIQRLFWALGTGVLNPLANAGLVRKRLAGRFKAMSIATDIPGTTEVLFRKTSRSQQAALMQPLDVQPVQRLFTTEWQQKPNATWVEKLMAHAIEFNARQLEPHRILYIEDAVSMKEGLQVRMPLLDEDLFTFGLTLPPHLLATKQTNKPVLRELAARMLPPEIATKRKQGFAFPLESWVSPDVKQALRDLLLTNGSGLEQFYKPETYKPMMEAFCEDRPYPGMVGNNLGRHVTLFMSTYLALHPQTQSNIAPAPALEL